MSLGFLRSTRSLSSDRGHVRAAVLFGGSLLFAGWAAWFFWAPVTMYEVSNHARLEVDRAAHPVSASVSGRIERINLELGVEVAAGDVLAVFDSEEQQLAIEEHRRRRDALPPQVEALKRQRAIIEATARARANGASASIDEADARIEQANARLALSKEELRSLGKLDADFRSGMELARVEAEEKTQAALAAAARSARRKLEWQQEIETSDQRAAIEGLNRDIARLEGDLATLDATIQRLALDVRRRQILAPIDGKIGEVSPVRPGEMVHEGDRLASIVPQGEIRIVTEFERRSALGRIRPGQTAELRLDGFPWLQYGTIGAHVVKVAAESRSNFVRVEMEVLPGLDTRIPLEHGLPGIALVEIEHVSPAVIFLRTTGKLFGQKAQRHEASEAQ